MPKFQDGDEVWIKNVSDDGKTRGTIVIASTDRSLVGHQADPASGCYSERSWYPNSQLTKR